MMVQTMMVTTRLEDVEREIAELEVERSQNAARHSAAATQLGILQSVNVTRLSDEELTVHTSQVTMYSTLVRALTVRNSDIEGQLRNLGRERRRLQEARVHGQNVERFKVDTIAALQARRADIVAQLAKVDDELTKMGVTVS